jgi:hypothetical protein
MFDISNLEVAPYGQKRDVVILENGPNSLHNCIVNKASLIEIFSPGKKRKKQKGGLPSI